MSRNKKVFKSDKLNKNVVFKSKSRNDKQKNVTKIKPLSSGNGLKGTTNVKIDSILSKLEDIPEPENVINSREEQNEERNKKSHKKKRKKGEVECDSVLKEVLVPPKKKSKKRNKQVLNDVSESKEINASLEETEECDSVLKEVLVPPKKKSKKRNKQVLNDVSESKEINASLEETEECDSVLKEVLVPPKKKSKKHNKQVLNDVSESKEINASLEEAEECDSSRFGIDPNSDSVDGKEKRKKHKSQKVEKKKITSKPKDSDESGDDSNLSDDESKDSYISEFDMDSYPSDTEDEMEKKRGLPLNAVPSAELEEKEKRTIFVGNLPYSVERPELKKWFSKFGKVECVRLRSAPIADPELPRKVAVIKKTFHEGRTNIHAYIRFRTIEASENALQANGAVFKDHIIRVDHSKHDGKYDPKKAIFIGNVPFALEEDTLRHFFSDCGEIESVRIVRDKKTGVGKGFAYVNFKCSTSIPLALKLDGEVLEKRELRVKPVKYLKKNITQIQRNFSPKFKGNKSSNNFKINKKINKSSKFQGEIGKRKTKKNPRKKTFLERKHDKFSKIFNSKKTD